MARTNIRIVKFYDGSRTAKEVMNDAIASKVRKKWIEVYIDIYGYYAKNIFTKTYFNKISFSNENY